MSRDPLNIPNWYEFQYNKTNHSHLKKKQMEIKFVFLMCNRNIASESGKVDVTAINHFYWQFMVIYNGNYFMEKNKPNFFMSINKAKYFTNISKSFAKLINRMTDESFVKHECAFRRILQECVNVSKIRNISS